MRLFAVSALLFLASCTDSGTGGERVAVDFVMRGESMDDGPIATSTSLVDPAWTIELDEAALLVGGVYAYPPLPRVTWLDRLDRFVGPSVARAHGGDDNMAGRHALFESLDAMPLEVLAVEAVSLGEFSAESGVVDTASIVLMPAYGDAARADGPTRGGVAYVRGRATNGESELPFEAVLAAGTTPLRRRVDGIAAEGTLADRAVVTLSVLPQEWLREVDFAAFKDAVAEDTDGVRRPPAESQFHAAWYLGVHAARSYRMVVANGVGTP